MPKHQIFPDLDIVKEYKKKIKKLVVNPYSRVVVDTILPSVFAPLYSFMCGVAAVLTFFSALSVFSLLEQHLAHLFLGATIAFSAPLAVILGLFFIYKRTKRNHEKRNRLMVLEINIEELRQENLRLNDKIIELISQFEKDYNITVVDDPTTEEFYKSFNKKKDIAANNFYNHAREYCIASGGYFTEKEKIKSRGLWIQSMSNYLLKFILDTALTVGTIIFLAPYIGITSVFVGFPLTLAVAIGVFVAFFTHVFVHRKNQAVIENISVMVNENSHHEKLNALLKTTLSNLEGSRAEMGISSQNSDSEEERASMQLVEKTEKDKITEKLSFFHQHRKLHRHGYYKKKLAALEEACKNYLIEKSFFSEKTIDKTVANNVIDCILNKDEAQLYNLTQQKLTRFNKNVVTAARILKQIKGSVNEYGSEKQTVVEIKKLIKYARSQSQFSCVTRKGNSELADKLEAIYEQVNSSVFVLDDTENEDEYDYNGASNNLVALTKKSYLGR